MSGVVAWFTGFPSAGKSTMARAVAGRLEQGGLRAVVLDGDEVRGALRPTPGYDPEARDAFYETLARLAAMLASQGHVVLVPATANRRAFRERARALAPRWIEVFVDTPLGECQRRDAKGLYAKAASGGVAALPGADAAYEPPEHPDLTAHALDEATLDRIVLALRG